MSNRINNRRNKKTSKSGKAGMISIPGDMSEETKQMAIRYQFIYSILGLSLGLVCMVLGTILFFSGISGGSASLLAEILGSKVKISDAGPGVLLFLVGLFAILITRFDLRVPRK